MMFLTGKFSLIRAYSKISNFKVAKWSKWYSFRVRKSDCLNLVPYQLTTKLTD